MAYSCACRGISENKVTEVLETDGAYNRKLVDTDNSTLKQLYSKCSDGQSPKCWKNCKGDFAAAIDKHNQRILERNHIEVIDIT